MRSRPDRVRLRHERVEERLRPGRRRVRERVESGLERRAASASRRLRTSAAVFSSARRARASRRSAMSGSARRPGVRSQPRKSAAVPPGSAARAAARTPAPSRVRRERDAAVEADRHAVALEHLAEDLGLAGAAAHEHGDVVGQHAGARQLEHLGGHQLGLGPLAAGLQQPHRAVGPDPAGARLEQPALEMVQRGAGGRRVVLGAVLQQLVALGQRLEQLDRRRAPRERRPARLVGERDADVGVPGERLDGVALERRQIVEPVQEHRPAAPGRRPLAQRVERRLGAGPRRRRPRAARAAGGRRSRGRRAPRRGRAPRRRAAQSRIARVKRAGPTSERPSSANSAPAAAANPGAAAERASTSSRASATAARTTRSRATGPSTRGRTPVASAMPRTSHENVATSAPSTIPSAASSRW